MFALPGYSTRSSAITFLGRGGRYANIAAPPIFQISADEGERSGAAGLHRDMRSGARGALGRGR